MQDYGTTAEEASESIGGAFISASGDFRDYIQRLPDGRLKVNRPLEEEEPHMLSTNEWKFDLPFKEFMDLISMHLGYAVLPQLSKGDYNVAFKFLPDTFKTNRDIHLRRSITTLTLVERSVHAEVLTIPRYVLEASRFKGAIITHDAGYQNFNKVMVSFDIEDSLLLSSPHPYDSKLITWGGEPHEVELAMWGL